jgi:AAA+ superfamily predicted ATPase
MAIETLNNQQGLISDDRQYIEAYFRTCELLDEKRDVLYDIKANEKEPKEPEKIRYLKDKVKRLNERIKDEDGHFWDQVKKSIDAGIKLSIEDLAATYKLSPYEKRMFLFFLYLEFCHVSDNICTEGVLSELFDFEDILFNRMRDFRYFSAQTPLVKHGFLSIDYVRHRASATATLLLTARGLNIITAMLNGEKKNTEDSEAGINSDICNDIGHVKEPEYSITDVVLKDEIREKVMFLLKASNEQGLKELGIQQKIKKGKGLIFLFYGPPGTGKSMLAEAVASYLKKKILIVEFPKITSRWYGDTDKNIANIFKSARENKLIICMDEADSLLYNRSYAVQEHDIRFVNVMLQEIERYDGEIILTTNMDTLLDPALERRVTLKVKFELPDEKLREQIWRSHIPDKVTLAQGIDFTLLARQFELSGGYIKNAVFHALRRLANENRKELIMEDLLFGARLEKDGMFVKENKPKIGFFCHS